MAYTIDYISTGKIQAVTFDNNKSKKTAIFKEPITKPTFLTKVGFKEDEQQYKGHGGLEKAVCLYAKDNYAFWNDIINKLPKFAIFGENLTVSGLDEHHLCIGDQYKIGQAIIEVSCPRQPCATIAQRYGIKDLVKRMASSCKTGCYFRVIQEGLVSPDDKLELVKQYLPSLSIYEINDTLYNDKNNQTRIQNILRHNAINEETRQIFNRLCE